MNKNSVIKNMGWRFAERCGVQGISFVVSVLLARILAPEEYGTVALVTVFIAILQIFVNGGFPNALIQKKDATELDFSTVFYFNFFFCIALYALLYFAAPSIAAFYDNEALTAIVRVLGLNLIISGLLAVQTAVVTRNMQFKKYFFSTVTGTLLSAVVGIGMARNGFGAWALVGQTLTVSAVSTVILWFTSGFTPKLMFSFASLAQLFSYGWKLLVVNLLSNIYSNLRTLIIGKVYSTTDLAYYNKGQNFPKLVIINLNTTISSVLFPAMARVQDDKTHLKSIVRRSIKTTGYLVWPCMVGLVACAEPLVAWMYTEKWLPVVPFMRLFCVSYAFMPIQTANEQAINAIGRSDISMKLQTIGKTVGVLTILVTMQFGVFAIAVGTVVVAIFEVFLRVAPNKKLINYGYAEQLKDIFPSMLLAIFMGICVWPLQYLNLPLALVLAIQVGAGATIYFALSALLKFETFFLLWDLFMTILSKARRKSA